MGTVLTALTLAGLTGAATAEDWPQFRGANASGVSAGRGLPLRFSGAQGVAWKADLGDGIASPVVHSGRVYSTAMAGNRFLVFCHELAGGRQVWKREHACGRLPRITPPNSHASSTPATDGKRVYVYQSTLGLLALAAEDGRLLWRHALAQPAYLMDWGAGMSPIVHGDSVYFCQDDDLNPFLICLDAMTGTPRWRIPRPDMLAGYAVPLIAQSNGRTELVVAGSGKMKGYDLRTGAELWTCNTLLRTIMTTPVYRDGVVYIAVQSYGDSARTLKFALLEWLDTNQDSVLTRPEVPAEFHARFDRSDLNQDGVLKGAELDTAFQHRDNQAGGGNLIQAIRTGGTGDVTRTHVLWTVGSKTPSNLASPLVSGDRLYVVKAGGLSSCYAIRDGAPAWELERIGNLGDYYASPVAGDGKIYLAGKNGFVVVLEDGPQFRVLAKNDLGEEILATPALCDGRIVVRTRTRLLCIGPS